MSIDRHLLNTYIKNFVYYPVALLLSMQIIRRSQGLNFRRLNKISYRSAPLLYSSRALIVSLLIFRFPVYPPLFLVFVSDSLFIPSHSFRYFRMKVAANTWKLRGHYAIYVYIT